MTSRAQTEANRQNAARSTGPRTPDGKARAARNATKHGLLARGVVIFDEKPDAYEELRDTIFYELEPVGVCE